MWQGGDDGAGTGTGSGSDSIDQNADYGGQSLGEMAQDSTAYGGGGGGGGGGGILAALHPKKGQTPDDCKSIAEGGGGAHAFDEFGTACWKVYGKAIKILPTQNSIMEGFIITNINFNAMSGQGALPNADSLPGDFSDSNHGAENGSQTTTPYSPAHSGNMIYDLPV